MKLMLGASLIALAFPLTGCGGATSTPQAAAPTYVESRTCRTHLATLLDIADLNSQNGLDRLTFISRTDQMNRTVDRAVSDCSDKVEQAVRDGLDKYAVATGTWTACLFSELCDPSQVPRQVVAAQASFTKARQLIQRKD